MKWPGLSCLVRPGSGIEMICMAFAGGQLCCRPLCLRRCLLFISFGSLRSLSEYMAPCLLFISFRSHAALAEADIFATLAALSSSDSAAAHVAHHEAAIKIVQLTNFLLQLLVSQLKQADFWIQRPPLLRFAWPRSYILCCSIS